MIRYAKTDDAAQVCEIYNHYVLGTSITFEEQPVSIEEMGQRIDETLQSLPWFVWEQDKSLKGFVTRANGKGDALTAAPSNRRSTCGPTQWERASDLNYIVRCWTNCVEESSIPSLDGIALPNDASVALHEKFEFEKVAQFRKVGNKFDRWTDVGYWQLLL
jgi:L-amino acid N-acyltransferase YncA